MFDQRREMSASGLEIARQVGRLGREDGGQRRIGQQLLGAAGKATRFLGLARCGGGKTMSQRLVAAVTARHVAALHVTAGCAEDPAQDAPRNEQNGSDDRQDRNEHRHRGVDMPVEPIDRDRTRPIGEPDRGRYHHGQQHDVDDQAQHDQRSSSLRLAASSVPAAKSSSSAASSASRVGRWATRSARHGSAPSA